VFKKLITILVLLAPSIGAHAQDKSGPKDRWAILNVMHSFDREFSKMRPYLVSSERFQDPKARAKIRASLDVLEKIVKGERPQVIESNPALNLNFSMMSYHLKTTKHLFEIGSYETARQNLNATSGFCVSCHTQVPVPKAKLGGFWSEDLDEPTTFASAEYLFITRRFDLALQKFDQLARNYPDLALTPAELGTLYNRKIALFARVRRDPKGAVENLEKDLANPKLPAEVRSNIQKWISYFRAWSAESPKVDEMKIDALMSYIRKSRPAKTSMSVAPSDPAMVEYLRLSGLLFEQLMKDPEGAYGQEVLYDLALFEKETSKLYWYSLYGPYLRECVLKYPKKPLTKVCFQLYEQEIREQFAGSMPVPDMIRSTLETMKKYL
jgi:hypothetical protein